MCRARIIAGVLVAAPEIQSTALRHPHMGRARMHRDVTFHVGEKFRALPVRAAAFAVIVVVTCLDDEGRVPSLRGL